MESERRNRHVIVAGPAWYPLIRHKEPAMKQNLVSLVFTPAEIEDLEAAITRIEKFTESFVTLTPDELRRLAKLGDGTEPFCRQAERVFEQYPHAFPPSFDLAEMQRDLATFDALRGPMLRLQQLVARFDDTVTALGSDVLVAALEGYRHMQSDGKSEGLNALKDAYPARRPRIVKKDPGSAA